MSMQKRFLIGTISGAGSVFIKTVLNILLIPFFIQSLGLEQYSFYVLLVGVLELVLLMDMGFASTMVKMLGASRAANEPEQAQSLLKTGQWLYLVMAVCAFIIGLFAIPWFGEAFHLPPAFRAMAPLALLIVLGEGVISLYSCYYRAVLLAHCAQHWANISDTLFVLVSNILSIALLIGGFDLVAVLLTRLVAAFIRTGVLMYAAVKLEPSALFPKATLSFKRIREIMTVSFHAMMVNISVHISHRMDHFVIATFLPLTAVGIFEIVFRFLSFALQVSSKMCEGILPVLTRLLSTHQTSQARAFFLRMSCLCNLTVCCLLLIIVSFYPQLFALFSAGKIPMQDTLPILWIAVPCVWSGVLQMPAGYYLFSSGRERYLSISSIVTALSNLILSIILVQMIGLVGVALGTLIPQLIQHQGSLVYSSCRGLNISLRDYIREVHLSILIPLLGTFLWIQLMRPALGMGLPPLLVIALIGAGAMIVAGILAFWFTALPAERALILGKLRKWNVIAPQPEMETANG